MKILMVNKFLHLNGGSETYILKLGEYLKRHGHQVEYFGMKHEGMCMENTMNVYTKEMDFHTGSTISKITYPFKIIYSVEARKKIRLILDEFSPDVVHLNNFNYQLTPSIILEIVQWRKKGGKECKIIYTAHDYQLICPNHMLYNIEENCICEKCIDGHFGNCLKNKCIHGSGMRSAIGALEAFFWNRIKVYRHIDKIICCSNFMKEKIDKNLILADKTLALHNFVEEHIDSKNEKKKYVLYFGRLAEEKGVLTLQKVCRALPDIPFVFAGNGPLENIMEKLPNVSYVGFKSGEELIKLISEAQFSIYPSEWYENCPFSVMESQMYGTPVVGARIGGIPELIIEGKTGLLFTSGDEKDLKAKIEFLWKDKKKIEEYSQNCIKTKFDTVEKYCEKLIQIYSGDL